MAHVCRTYCSTGNILSLFPSSVCSVEYGQSRAVGHGAFGPTSSSSSTEAGAPPVTFHSLFNHFAWGFGHNPVTVPSKSSILLGKVSCTCASTSASATATDAATRDSASASSSASATIATVSAISGPARDDSGPTKSRLGPPTAETHLVLLRVSKVLQTLGAPSTTHAASHGGKAFFMQSVCEKVCQVRFPATACPAASSSAYQHVSRSQSRKAAAVFPSLHTAVRFTGSLGPRHFQRLTICSATDATRHLPPRFLPSLGIENNSSTTVSSDLSVFWSGVASFGNQRLGRLRGTIRVPKFERGRGSLERGLGAHWWSLCILYPGGHNRPCRTTFLHASHS